MDVVVRGEESPVGGPKAAALLTALVMRANQWVSLDQLTSAVWGDTVPPSARVNLRGYVGQIRNALRRADPATGSRLLSGRGSYRIRLEPGEVDVDYFHALQSQAAAALRQHDPALAIRLFDRALAFWRGRAAENVPRVPAIEPFTSALDERGVSVREDRLAALLTVGENAAVVSGARALLADNPNRERAWALLMLALYRLGDAPAALAAYQSARTGLQRRLGIEPGAHLVDLQRLILNREAGLGSGWHPSWAPFDLTEAAPSRPVGARRRHRAPTRQ